MAATSPPRRRRPVRLASMETLGFFDTPTTATTDRYSRPAPSPMPVAPGPARGTGDLITDLWEKPEEEAPTLADWRPQPAHRHLQTKSIHWSIVVLVTGVLIGLVAGGYWIYQRSGSRAEAAAATVAAEAEDLASALEALAPHAEDLSSGALEDEAAFTAAALAVNRSARSLFDASAGLPGSEQDNRTLAADASSAALDATRTLNDAYAYLLVLEPALIPPALETDASVVDLTAAVEDFGSWRARMSSVAEALPTGVAGEVSAQLTMLISSLDTVQSDYVDALGSGERFDAVPVVEEITVELEALGMALIGAVAEEAEEAAAEIAKARSRLDQLVG